ncbi:anthrone oxygenase family protein [Embleya sp. NPDC005971]|uniref:anthrone oxygenase family protein n=1 Tax=unclassified Embleya TaxID=2699296 RepID=UPI00340E5842
MTEQSTTAPETARPTRTAAVLLGATLLTTGLVAGVYFCFAVAIMPGLGHVDDRTFIDVLQQVNKRIENPVFFACFFGAPILGVISIVQTRKLGHTEANRWIIAGVALAFVGMLITIGGNIPLNNKLRDAGDPAKIADPAKLRDDVENAWIAWNTARTLAATAALATLTRATRLLPRTSHPS